VVRKRRRQPTAHQIGAKLEVKATVIAGSKQRGKRPVLRTVWVDPAPVGRPSVRVLVCAEAEKRLRNGQAPASFKAFANDLVRWLSVSYNIRRKPRTIENMVRDIWRSLIPNPGGSKLDLRVR
jgi:hypothetical protein